MTKQKKQLFSELLLNSVSAKVQAINKSITDLKKIGEPDTKMKRTMSSEG